MKRVFFVLKQIKGMLAFITNSVDCICEQDYVIVHIAFNKTVFPVL